MQLKDLIFIAVIVCVFAAALIRYFVRSRKRCEKCGGKYKLEKLEDPMGVNVSNKISFSLYKGPRKYKETWKCESCGHKSKFSYWGG